MNVRMSLEHLALLRVAGADRDAFLQGQLSSDIAALTPERAQLTSFNSPKGRVLAVMQLVRHGDTILMLLPASIAGAVRQRIALYILRSKAVVEEAAGLRCFGLAGPDAAGRVAALTGAAPPGGDWGVAAGNGRVAWRVPGPVARLVVAGPGDAIESAWGECADFAGADDAYWRLQDVLAGLPEITPATQDAFVAQMLRLDELGAISFNKGCYTGQEVIARAHYRGRVKRHSAAGRSESAAIIEPAATLADASGQTAATVVHAAPDPDGGQVVLAVLQREYPAGTGLRTPDGVVVRF